MDASWADLEFSWIQFWAKVTAARCEEETKDIERGRWSGKKKTEAVLRLLKGENLDTLSRELKVNPATLSAWRETLLESGIAGLTSRQVDARDEKKEQLLWIRSFATIEELRCALIEWAQLYNERWIVERHQHKLPAQARRE